VQLKQFERATDELLGQKGPSLDKFSDVGSPVNVWVQTTQCIDAIVPAAPANGQVNGFA
jgi:hypothetical protein